MKIAFIGKICTGKTYISKQLANIHNCKIFSFASKIKELAADLFDMKQKDRKLLQDLGEKMREINYNVWVNYLIKKIKDEERVIIDDLRYTNEYNALRENGFIIIKLEISKEEQINRIKKTYPNTYQEHISRLNHVSETNGDNLHAHLTVKSDENALQKIRSYLLFNLDYLV